MSMVQIDRENYDEFPGGLRVLAVDDDPVGLKIVESMLRRCEFHVTAASQAILAIKLLREDKDQFDLVISEVAMPDIDGFKRLQIIMGLKTDLPVIMVSTNCDPKVVMKGNTHNDCDYLLKPVRIEELKNIWQQILTRKTLMKLSPFMYMSSLNGLGAGQAHIENFKGSDDASTLKLPRVVWTEEVACHLQWYKLESIPSAATQGENLAHGKNKMERET